MEPDNDIQLSTNRINSITDNFIPKSLESNHQLSLQEDIIPHNNNIEGINLINQSSNKNNLDFIPVNNNLKNDNNFMKQSSRSVSTFRYENKLNENKSFSRLQNIQKLLKKESALKGLFIKTSNETLKSIENECREIYKKKLEVFTQLQKFSRKEKEIRKYLLVDEKTQKNNLKNLYNYIPKFLLYLWDEPKMIVKLLQNASIKDIKNYLAPLLANNFYENILSVNYIEENFLYVLCLLLKDEIQGLNSSNDVQKFLQETPCGLLLDQLINKNDIKSYFKIIIQNVVENIEINCSEKEMNFNIENIEKEIQNSFQNTKNKNSIIPKDDIIFRKDISLSKKNSNEENINEGLNDAKDRYSDTASTKTFNTSEYTKTNSFIFNGIKFQEIEKNKEKELFDIETYDLFSTKYMPDLTTIELNLRLKTCDNFQMKDYLQFQINNTIQNKLNNDNNSEKKINPNFYSNEKFLQSVFISNYSNMIIYCYQYDFMKVINIIEELFKSLLGNLPLLPYSIKCLCKIISVLIKKKFHGLSNTEENSFVAKFFFCKLFAPIFKNPATFALINKYIISGKTIHNLEIITPIILQLVSGRLYRNGGSHSDFTPFNWFFLDQMPSVLKFFDYITNKVKLPNFIEQCINDKLDENFKYNYFQENPEEVICHRSICFNIYDINCLLDNIKKCEDILFTKDSNNNIGLQKTFEKLYNKTNQNIINELKLGKNYEKNELANKVNEMKTPIINYYLVTDFIYNQKCKDLFELDIKIPHYNIKELKDIKNNDENIKNNLIKVKNYLNTLLYNYRSLVKTDFEEGTAFNLINILRELKIFMKSSNFVIDGTIPSEWYINSLIEFLGKIPEEYRINDYELLFNSIEKEISDSIDKVDFEILSICLDKMKYIRKNIIYYDNTKEILLDILLNNKVNKIIEDDGIKVELSFVYEKDKKLLLINKVKKAEKQLQFLDNMIFQSTKKGIKLCRNIEEFTKYFPNLNALINKEEANSKDVFNLQKELNLPQKLDEYFDYVKEYLIKEKKIKDQQLFELINEKIYDYVMSKIYDRIFPKEPSKIDIDIYEKTVSLSWIEPRHIISEKTNYVYDTFLPDVINNIYLLDKNKSPRIKFKNLSNIFMNITNIVKFNNNRKEDIGVDDLMPILNYSFIKAQPIRFHSNCKFMELYIGDLMKKSEGSQLTQMNSICMRIIDINHNTLNNVDVREFENKCFQCLYDKINSAYKE